MTKTFKPELMRVQMIAETRGEAEAVELMVEYLLQYGNDILAKVPFEMLNIARPAVARANEILAEREKAEAVETVETEEQVEEIDVKAVIAGLTAGHGLGALQAMIRANSFIVGKDYLQFKFKGCKEANTLVVRYDAGLDLYNMEFIKAGTRNFLPYADIVKEVKGIYTVKLKDVFESFTGLYTTL